MSVASLIPDAHPRRPANPPVARQRWGLPELAVLGYFAVTLGLGTSTEWNMPREMLVFLSVVSFALLLFGFFLLFLRHCLTRDVFFLGPLARRAVIRLGFWVAIVSLSTLVGIASGHQWNYVTGDFYKFSQMVVLFLACYFIFRQRSQENLFLQALVILAAAATLEDLIRNWWAISAGLRLTTRTAYYLPLLLSLQWYLIGAARRLSWRVFGLALLGILLTGLLVSHSRGMILNALVGMSLFGLIPLTQRGKRLQAVILMVVAVATLGLVTYLLPSPIAGAVDATLARFQATSSQLGAVGSRDPYAIDVLGSRIPELMDIFGEFRSSPQYLFLGFGMGSEVETVSGVNLETGKTHFIHVGWGEILYRSGLAGLSAFLMIYFFFLGLARKATHSVKVGTLGLVLAAQYGLTFLTATPFISDAIVFAVFGITVARMEMATAQDS